MSDTATYYAAGAHSFVFDRWWEDPQGNDGNQIWLWQNGSTRRLTSPGEDEVDHAANGLAFDGRYVVYDKR